MSHDQPRLARIVPRQSPGHHRPIRRDNVHRIAARTRGRLVLDDGAVKAVQGGRASLLPAGVTAVEGEFDAGDPVELVTSDGRVVARGLVAFESRDIPDLLGRSTTELRAELGEGYDREVVHRDDLVLVRKRAR